MAEQAMIEERMADRMSFLIEAVTMRELRGWPNDPVHNAAIIYAMYGWSFDEKDGAMIRAERSAGPKMDSLSAAYHAWNLPLVASAIEARRAAAAQTDAVHESAVGNAETPTTEGDS